MKIDIRGTREVKQALAQMKARALDLSPVLTVAIQDLKTMGSDAFRKGVDPGTGSLWAPLQESTLARRRKGTGKGGPKTLVDTATLRNSLAVAKAKSSVETIGKDFILFGTTVPYAAVHQDGSKKRKIPKRAFLPEVWNRNGTLAQYALSKIASRVRNYILTGNKSVESGFKTQRL